MNKTKKTIKERINHYTENGTKPYNYVYFLNINQKVVIDNDWDLDIIDIAIFYAIKSFIEALENNNIGIIENNGFNNIVIDKDNKRWYYISEYKILKDLPLLPLSSGNAVYKRIKKLIDCKLIERKNDNVKNRLKLIRLGSNSIKFTYTV